MLFTSLLGLIMVVLSVWNLNLLHPCYFGASDWCNWFPLLVWQCWNETNVTTTKRTDQQVYRVSKCPGCWALSAYRLRQKTSSFLGFCLQSKKCTNIFVYHNIFVSSVDLLFRVKYYQADAATTVSHISQPWVATSGLCLLFNCSPVHNVNRGRLPGKGKEGVWRRWKSHKKRLEASM